jgi:hypothetical protein
MADDDGLAVGNDQPVRADAVVYRIEGGGDEPELWHVEDVYRGDEFDSLYVHVVDGTHTCEAWHRIEDFRDMYVPAGWQASTKPTYVMTRQYGHAAYPRDLMASEVYDAAE